ncbi:MAG TPA: type II toxin-antitoxin system VapC family toxin [Tepidisphaeraceae bacterium]|nr:type II toxin-antitoxin system VapC family toxin [Tepidisphaeraceae bacterium]
MSFLLDTDICSAYLKGHRGVANRFLQYTGGLHISVVTLGELYTWALRASAPPTRLQALHDLLSDVVVLDATADVSRRFGEVRAELLDKGLPPPDMDLLNAATALFHDLTLVTHNTKDYQNIPGLRLIDWLQIP